MAAAAKKSGKKKGGKRLIGIVTLIAAAICLPSAVILAVGMLPSLAAALTDKARQGMRSWTIGTINAAGCFPFLLELWTKGNSFAAAMQIVADPRTVVVIYIAAGVGYLIDWSLTGLVATLLTQKAERRRKAIDAKQAELVRRWGREVTGDIPLDVHGFAAADQDS